MFCALMVIAVLKVAAACELPNRHSRRMGGFNSGGAVFDDKALLRWNFHFMGHVQEYVRRWFSTLNHGCREYPVLHPGRKVSHLQRPGNAKRAAAGCYAIGNGEIVEHLDDTRHGIQIGAESSQKICAVIGLKGLAHAGAMRMGKFRSHRRKAVPQKMLKDKGQVYGHANFSESFNKHLRAQILAVNEHAITIKNYEGNFAQAESRQVEVAMKKLTV